MGGVLAGESGVHHVRDLEGEGGEGGREEGGRREGRREGGEEGGRGRGKCKLYERQATPSQKKKKCGVLDIESQV